MQKRGTINKITTTRSHRETKLSKMTHTLVSFVEDVINTKFMQALQVGLNFLNHTQTRFPDGLRTRNDFNNFHVINLKLNFIESTTLDHTNAFDHTSQFCIEGIIVTNIPSKTTNPITFVIPYDASTASYGLIANISISIDNYLTFNSRHPPRMSYVLSLVHNRLLHIHNTHTVN